MTIPQVLLLTGILNAIVAIYIYGLVPEFLLRFLAWILVHLIYRLDKRGIDNIPETALPCSFAITSASPMRS